MNIELGVDECNPAFCRIPIPSTFDIYKMEVKNNNLGKLIEYEDSLINTEPENFLALSKRFYMNNNIK